MTIFHWKIWKNYNFGAGCTLSESIPSFTTCSSATNIKRIVKFVSFYRRAIILKIYGCLNTTQVNFYSISVQERGSDVHGLSNLHSVHPNSWKCTSDPRKINSQLENWQSQKLLSCIVWKTGPRATNSCKNNFKKLSQITEI